MKNEEIINKLLEKSIKYLDTAEAFTIKEVPLYVQELLEFKFFEHITGAFITPLVCIPLIIFCVAAVYMGIKKNEEGMIIPFGIIGTTVFIILSIAGPINLYEEGLQAYKAKYAPRVYLMDYVKKQ